MTYKRDTELKPDRMELLPNNPGTIRDTATEKNYHLGSKEEAAELVLIINGLDAYAKFLIDSYEEQIEDLKGDLSLAESAREEI